MAKASPSTPAPSDSSTASDTAVAPAKKSGAPALSAADGAKARSYVDRLILTELTHMEAAVKLGELAERLSGHGLGLASVRSLMASNPNVFAYNDRRWIPAARLAAQGRPFAETLRLIVAAFGAPVSLADVTEEVARARRVPLDEVEPALRRIAENDANFVLLDDGRVALAEWGFEATDEPLDRALALNGVTREELEGAQAKLGSVDWRSDSVAEEALKAAAPIKIKTVGAVAFAALNSDEPHSPLLYDNRALLAGLFAVPGYVYSGDGTFATEEDAKRWVNQAIRMAEGLTATIDLDDAAPIEVKTEDLGRIVDRILGQAENATNGGTTTGTSLLETFYEIVPGTRTFPNDMANLMDALRGDERVQWVGGDRFRKAGDVPEYLGAGVPEPFRPVKTDVRDEEGELMDVELTDEGLSTSLRKLLQHPLALDVLDEDPQPAPKQQPESIRLVLKSLHRELGTFPLAQVPTGWLDPEPTIQEAIFRDPAGRELQVWIDNDDRLMYNLIDWWYEQPVESGAVFTLSKTARPNVFDFAYLEQPDPVVFITPARMEELRTLGATADEEGKSTFELLTMVMAHWPKGADYLTLLAEMNVARRTSRRLVASLLSSYACFYQRQGSPVFHFDPKKVANGFDKSKRKYVKS